MKGDNSNVNIMPIQMLASSYRNRRMSGILIIPILVRWVTVIFIFSQVCYAPFRFFMAKFGLEDIVYLPKILLLVMIPLMLLSMKRISKIFMIGVIIVGLSTVWGIINLPSVNQSLFAVWVIIPLLYGVLLARYIFDDMVAYKNTFIAFLLVACVGVFVNVFIQYPWTGASYEIYGVTIQAAREWWAFGVDRIGGFSAASFDAAMQIMFFSVWLMLVLKADLSKLSLWIVSGLAIAITTTKGILGVYLILSLYFASAKLFKNNLIWRQLWVVILTINVLTLIFLPLSTVIIRYDPVIHGYMNRFIFASFGDRLDYTWPASFNLLHGGAQWLLGRGLGGIGTPQTYFEPSNALPADNLYVYLAVDLGPIAAAIILIGVYFKSSRSFLRKNSALMPFLILLFAYGMVSNIIEAPILSLFLGVVISKAFQNVRAP